MNDEQDELHKPDSSERRLRLRKDYKERYYRTLLCIKYVKPTLLNE